MIEKNIHQIWVGGKKMPTHIKEYVEKLKDAHKGFTHYLWTDENLPELPHPLKMVYDSYNEPAIKADLLRLYVVYTYGGYYLDIDFITINGFNLKRIFKDGYEGMIVYNPSYKLSALANSIFGFRKGSLVLKFMLDDITTPMKWIGPNWWTQIVSKYLKTNIEVLTIEEFEKKLNHHNVQLGNWADIEIHCFRHEPLSSWVIGSPWYNKLERGDYD